MNKGRKITRKERADIRARYARGEGLDSLTARYGLGYRRVRAVITDVGMVIRPKQAAQVDRYKMESIRSFRGELSSVKCAIIHGVSPSTVWRIWQAR